MGFDYSILNRLHNEELSQFDSRIEQLSYIEVGRVYFDVVNYNYKTADFSILIKWDPRFEDKINDRFPEGGYCLKANKYQAYQLQNEKTGIPLKVLLCSVQGRIFIKRILAYFNNRPYNIEFTGCHLIPWDCDVSYYEDSTKEFNRDNSLTGSAIFRGVGANNMGSGYGFYGSGFYFAGSGMMNNWGSGFIGSAGVGLGLGVGVGVGSGYLIGSGYLFGSTFLTGSGHIWGSTNVIDAKHRLDNTSLGTIGTDVFGRALGVGALNGLGYGLDLI